MNSKILSITGAYHLLLSVLRSLRWCSRGVVGNEFPAIQTVGAGAAACTGAEVSTNLTADHQKINAGMQGNQQNTHQQCCNSSIVALMNEDVIRPLAFSGQTWW